jgi:hypothetical protein
MRLVYVWSDKKSQFLMGNFQKHLLSFRFSVSPMTLQSTKTCFSTSPKRDSILSITPSKFYLITITPFKVSAGFLVYTTVHQNAYYLVTTILTSSFLSVLTNLIASPFNTVNRTNCSFFHKDKFTSRFLHVLLL